ncbi:hypothetical protein EIP91_002899 [Steccherinum ochraceum]|uniref:Uncharacterized protein n=1 Tax=Steccherinum ochraceum TaxID=92696 RepID=A0A4R0RT76_9APHY|nr:hypothetical protein EIP91_002899 [Steccherinum ochraceum]
MNVVRPEELGRPITAKHSLVSPKERLDDKHIIAQLKEELVLLREENQALREEHNRLRLEKDAPFIFQKHENTYRKLPKRQYPTWESLEPGVLKIIFEAAVPPSAFLDPSPRLGPISTWCKAMFMKKALVRVCKLWTQAALPLLYNEVALRRAGQVLAFARTIQSSNLSAASLVRSISFICDIPTPLRRVVICNAAKILRSCSRVISLTFVPDFIGCYSRSLHDQLEHTTMDADVLLSALRDRGPGIQELGYYDWSFSDYPKPLDSVEILPLRLMPAFSNLKSLHLPISKCPWSLDDMRLEALEELTVLLMVSNGVGNHLRAVAAWHMPRLQRVCIRSKVDLQCNCDVLMHLLTLFERHGTHLKELTVVYGIHCDCAIRHTDNRTWTSLASVLDRCPSLTYLVISSLFALAGKDELFEISRRNPGMRVDISCSAHGHEDWYKGNPRWYNYRTVDPKYLASPGILRRLARPASSEPITGEYAMHDIYDSYIVDTTFCLAPPWPSLSSIWTHPAFGPFDDRDKWNWHSARADNHNGAMVDYAFIRGDSTLRPPKGSRVNFSSGGTSVAISEDELDEVVVWHNPHADSDSDYNGPSGSEYEPSDEGDDLSMGSDSDDDDSQGGLSETEPAECDNAATQRELDLEVVGLREELSESVDVELTEEEALEIFSATLDVGCIVYKRSF